MWTSRTERGKLEQAQTDLGMIACERNAVRHFNSFLPGWVDYDAKEGSIKICHPFDTLAKLDRATIEEEGVEALQQIRGMLTRLDIPFEQTDKCITIPGPGGIATMRRAGFELQSLLDPNEQIAR